MKRSPRAAALFAVCLIAIASGSHAWFLATEQGETAPDTTVATSPPRPTRATAVAPTLGGRGKVQEASPAHKRLLEQDLLRMGPSATLAPAADHVTKVYWPPDQLPNWLPKAVRQRFELENGEAQRQRAGLPEPTPTPGAPAAVHVTRDYWEIYPSWLQRRVKEEMQRDNKEFLRRMDNAAQREDTTPHTPEHVTRSYWEVLPSWLPPSVKRQFDLENLMIARRLSQRDSDATTAPPSYEHVTRNFWEILPTWLPKRVHDEIKADNEKYIRQLVGIEDATSTEQKTVGVDPTIASRPSSEVPVRPAAASRRIQSGALRRAPSQPPMQPPPPPPTRQPLTVDSVDLLPQKCKRQLDWRNQQKCSSSRSKWTFDMVDLQCKWFAHYGCQLNNGNLFNSLADCQNYCVRRILNPCEAVRCEQRYTLYQSECFLLNDSECNNRFLQKYSAISNPEARMALARDEIELFCQPSAARCRNTGTHVGLPTFESPPTYVQEARLPAHCELPQDRGFCRGNQRGRLSRVYFYSKRQNQCKFMVNFGCSRNQNYFANLADCYNSCGL